MPAAAVPTPPPAPEGWTLDKRQVIGAALGLLCIGVLIGFKIASGGEPLVIERPVERTVFVDKPCADCEEKARTQGGVESVPGDSSVPED